MDKDLVRRLIRHKLHEGRLPRSRAVYIRSAQSDGQPCAACDQRIERNQQAVLGIAAVDWATIHFHEDCFRIWDVERLTSSGEKLDGGRS